MVEARNFKFGGRLDTGVLWKKCKITSTWAWAGSRDPLF